MSLAKVFTGDTQLWLDAHPCDTHDLIGPTGPRPEYPITGVTTNPSILADYIHRTPGYQTGTNTTDRIARVVEDGASRLLALHETSGKKQGWISAQISPEHMEDAEAIVRQGKFYASASPNVMVKVPCNGEGLAAIEELVAMGISINGTMTFYASQVREFALAVARGRDRLPGHLSSPTTVVTHMIGRVSEGIHSTFLRVAEPKQLRMLECAIAKVEQAILRNIEPQSVLLLSSIKTDIPGQLPLHIDALAGSRAIFTIKPSTLKDIAALPESTDRDTAFSDVVTHLASDERDLKRNLPDIPGAVACLHLDDRALDLKDFSSLPQFAQVRSEITLNASLHRYWNSVSRTSQLATAS